MTSIFHLFLLLATILLAFPAKSAWAYKILVFSPSISRSHMISNARIATVLAKDGHDVTLLELDFGVSPDQFNVSSQPAKLWRIPGSFFPVSGEELPKLASESAFFAQSLVMDILKLNILHSYFNQACEKFIVSNSDQLERLRAEKFDVILAEQLNFCGAGLKHLLAIPTHILLSSCTIQEHVASLVGLPVPTSYVPSVFDADVSDKMSLWDRLYNLFRTLGSYNYLFSGMDPLTKMFRKHFGEDFPDLRLIVNESPLVFVATDELLDFPRPIFNNIIHIGGLGMKLGEKGRELEEPFKSEMSKGKKGVVYFSMGTIVSMAYVDQRFPKNVFQAFADLPDYHFIVKMEIDANSTIKPSDNVFITKWVPQTDLLKHARLRLFITHGGYNSLIESAGSGVPLIAMSFFADQQRNAYIPERNGWGLAFEKRELLTGSEKFRESIARVAEDRRFADNAKRIQKLLLTKPFTAEERLTKNIRFLEQNGGKLPELLSESRNMGPIALYNLDLIVLLAVIGIIICAVTALLALWLWRRVAAYLTSGSEEKRKDD